MTSHLLVNMKFKIKRQKIKLINFDETEQTTMTKAIIWFSLNDDSLQGGGDPHFMLRIDGVVFPVCFDIPAKEGDVLRMLSDRISGTLKDYNKILPKK